MRAGLLPYLRLCRAGTLFSPAADVIAGLCLCALPWSADGVRLMLASVLLYAAGMVLNDHADRAVDARQRPERPIPRGQISAGQALSLGVGLMLAGLLLSPARYAHGLIAGGILAYDYLVKQNALAGAFNMAGLRALNLAVACALLPGEGIHIPEPLGYAMLGYGIYIFAVTLLGILEDASRIPARAAHALAVSPALVAALVVHSLPGTQLASWLGFGAAAWLLYRHRDHPWDQAAVRGAMRHLLLGTMVYTALLCLGMDRWVEALIVATLILPARAISRHIALT